MTMLACRSGPAGRIDGARPAGAPAAARSLLIVEDDGIFGQRLARALELRGFAVRTAGTAAAGLEEVARAAPAYAVVDMRLSDGNGLDVLSALARRRPAARAVVLTGYGSIAAAVNAVKLGAVDYLAKPVDADDVAGGAVGARRRQHRSAGKSDVRQPRPLGAHPARLRTLRPQHDRYRPPPPHASPHAATHSLEARAQIKAQRGPMDCSWAIRFCGNT